MTPPKIGLSQFDELSDAELTARIDYYLQNATDPGCSPHLLAGQWVGAGALLGERGRRASKESERTMLWLTKAVAWMTAVVTVATLVSLGITWWQTTRPPPAAVAA